MINRVESERIYEARTALFTAAERDGRLMAIAVTDEAAELVYAERMVGCHSRVLRHAIRKAYTAATMQRDTRTLWREDVERGKTLADWGDLRLTHLGGGVVVMRGAEFFGGVGVGGHIFERDEELARLASDLLASETPGQEMDTGLDPR